MEATSPAPAPFREAPVSPTLSTVAVETSASTISTLFKYAGNSNEISIRDDLSVNFGDTGIRLPAGSGFSYVLSELGGTIDFRLPKPVITTHVAGLEVHPILDRIVLRQPNQAVAYATDLFGIQHTKVIELPDSAEKPSESVPQPAMSRRSLPSGGQVYIWSLDSRIQDEVKDYNNFTFNPGRKCFSSLRPAIEYCQSGRTYRQLGWQGLDRLISDSSTEFKAQSTSASVPTAKAAVGTLHSHRCTHVGTKFASYAPSVWSHTSASKGSVHDHTCPICGTLQWNVYD